MPAACAFPGSTRPVIKIGLVAPFEGEQRHNGYQRLYGVKLALQEANLSGGVAGRSVELVALNDYADPEETVLQARELVIDTGVKAVIGSWNRSLFDAALPVYAAAQLPVVNPTRFDNPADVPPHFEAGFQAISGSPPDAQARQAYLATRYLLQAVERAVARRGNADRPTMWRVLNP